MSDTQRIAEMIKGVALRCGDDGTGDIGLIVRQAIADDPDVTVDEIVEIVRTARSDFAADLLAEASKR